MFNLTKREKVIIIVSLVLLVAIGGTFMLNYNKTKPIQLEVKDTDQVYAQQLALQKELVKEQEPPETKKIMVHIKGQVKNPGVVTLDEGKRVWDALKLAGGELDTADLNAVNLAAPLRDGQDVYIPAKGERVNNMEAVSSQQTLSGNNGKININTAGAEELDKLPGIGTATAKKIIDFRNQNNGFKTIEDIMNVPGIGEKKFEQIKDLIEVR
ncbi:MAG: competence protein ComEA [Petroclostridium sp.]|jgi:competence protein ComEA|uniref:helix-hairpin-helix domain-containing protein n=1 Tax=Petroclostridium xylanilyticum TaxID=1792311 RepID=UPI000B9871F8|nr:helix-hairpin-helix domain-containing protein [Petroclostridium xylanilyticum]MBZ4645114.1 competence protein ComEA-like protein with helix-hairpin-helix repeat region [Clostridia bacterium]MDK2810749.1 competence protein ComEA [Petroclostridium sp.]